MARTGDSSNVRLEAESGGRYHDEYGREHREKVGTSKTAAREVYRKRKTQVRDGKFHPEDVARKKRLLLADVIKEYMKESEATKRSWKDDKRYAQVWTEVLGGQTLDVVKPADIEAWRRDRQKDGLTPATINRYVAFLKRVFNVAIRDEKCQQNPVARVKLYRENNARIRFLTEDEELRLREAFPADRWHFIELALNTGLRQSEQFGLRWDHVDFANNVLTIPRSKHGEKRHVPMNPRVKDILRGMPSLGNRGLRLKGLCVYHPPPAESKHGRGTGRETEGITFPSIRTTFENAVKGAGLDDLRWHDLRHTFASRLVMKGADLRTVQELMGHRTILMTQRYAHLTPSHLQAAVDLLCDGSASPKPSPKPSPSKHRHQRHSITTL